VPASPQVPAGLAAQAAEPASVLAGSS
jgi:hypothetical protein